MGGPPAARVTIRDVAREAGVSISTASDALNGRGRVSDATRERVRDVAERLEYRPNRAARSLRLGHSMTIGVLVPSLSNPVYEAYLRGAVHEAADRGYTILIGDAEHRPELFKAQVEKFLGYGVDALIVGEPIRSPDLFGSLRETHIPIDPPIAIDETGRLQAPQVVLDRPALLSAFGEMLACGHRHFLHLRRRRTLPAERPAIDAYIPRLREAAEQAGVSDLTVEVHELDVDGGEDDAIRRHLAETDATALFVVVSLLESTLDAIRAAGWTIPGDVSLFSVGDTRTAQTHAPPITVVASDAYVDGRRAVMRVIGEIAGDAALARRGSQQPKRYIPRESIGPAPSRTTR